MKTREYITQEEIMHKMPYRRVKMAELLTEFEGRGEVRGFAFKQLMKSEMAYMYVKTFEGLVFYEVFLRVENKRFNCIAYPGSRSFGVWAWDYRDYDKALRKFNLQSGTELSD